MQLEKIFNEEQTYFLSKYIKQSESTTISPTSITKKNREISNKKIKDTALLLNNYLKSQGIKLKLEVKNENQLLQVNLIDTKTNKVIQSIPPDTILKIAKQLEKLIGVFIDKNF
ncbi:flagellar protein FlaG [Desulfonauticus submarinus]